ncbi:MAG: HAD family hydrolase [Desulfobacterales bacterium]
MKPSERVVDYLSPMLPQPTSMTPGGRLKERIRCVLFDIYGTLFISGSGDIGVSKKALPQLQKLDRLLQQFNLRKKSREIIQELSRAIDDEHRRLRDTGIDYPEIEIDQIWKQILKIDDLPLVRRFAIQYELIVNPIYPMPNLKTTLAASRQKHVPMGIISNAQFFTPLLFEWFLGAEPEGLGFHSDLIFLSYQIRHAKPSTKPFELAAAAITALGLKTSSALYVGNDMLNDIYPAHQLGFQTALFAGDARSLRLRPEDPRCIDLSADIILTDLAQILGYLM